MAETNTTPKRYILNLSLACSIVSLAAAIWVELRKSYDGHEFNGYRSSDFHVQHMFGYWAMFIGAFLVLIVAFTFLQKFLSRHF
jgi:hypothetical protein